MRHRGIYYGDPVNRASPLNRGLVSWWMAVPWYMSGPRFIDLCGRNHGTLTNGPTWSGALGRAGGYGGVRVTGGSSIVLSLPAIASSQDFFLSFDVFPVSWPGPYTALLDDSARDWSAFFRESGQLNYEDGPLFTLSGATAAIEAGKWSRLVMTRIGTASSSYLNGATFAGYGPTSSSLAAASVYFGNNISGGGSHFDGVYDNFRFALRGITADEAFAEYQSSRRGYPTELNRFRRRRGQAQAAAGGATAYPWHYYQQMMAG